MHHNREQLDSDEMTSVPPDGCDLKVGDIVTFTNDYGLEFPGKEIVGFTLPKDELHGKTVYTKGDAYWFPSSPDSLEKTMTILYFTVIDCDLKNVTSSLQKYKFLQSSHNGRTEIEAMLPTEDKAQEIVKQLEGTINDVEIYERESCPN